MPKTPSRALVVVAVILMLVVVVLVTVIFLNPFGLVGHAPGAALDTQGMAPDVENASQNSMRAVDSSGSSAIGNLVNGGYMAASGDGTLFVADPVAGTDWETRTIVRCAPDGSGAQVIFAAPAEVSNLYHISIVGDTVVFNQIQEGASTVVAMRTDGSGARALDSCDDWSLCQVVDGQVYHLKGGTLWRTGLDGSDGVPLAVLAPATRWRVSGSRLITYPEEGAASVTLSDITGTNPATIFECAPGYAVANAFPLDDRTAVVWERETGGAADRVVLVDHAGGGQRLLWSGPGTVARLCAGGAGVVITTSEGGSWRVFDVGLDGSKGTLDLLVPCAGEVRYTCWVGDRVLFGVVEPDAGYSCSVHAVAPDGSGLCTILEEGDGATAGGTPVRADAGPSIVGVYMVAAYATEDNHPSYVNPGEMLDAKRVDIYESEGDTITFSYRVWSARRAVDGHMTDPITVRLVDGRASFEYATSSSPCGMERGSGTIEVGDGSVTITLTTREHDSSITFDGTTVTLPKVDLALMDAPPAESDAPASLAPEAQGGATDRRALAQEIADGFVGGERSRQDSMYHFADVYGDDDEELFLAIKSEQNSGYAFYLYTFEGGARQLYWRLGYPNEWYEFYKQTDSFVSHGGSHGNEWYYGATMRDGTCQNRLFKGRASSSYGGYDGPWVFQVDDVDVDEATYESTLATMRQGESIHVSGEDWEPLYE